MISPGFVVSVLATLAIAVVFLFLVFEDWALWSNQRPITEYVRRSWQEHPHIFWLGSVIVAALLGHFGWN